MMLPDNEKRVYLSTKSWREKEGRRREKKKKIGEAKKKENRAG